MDDEITEHNRRSLESLAERSQTDGSLELDAACARCEEEKIGARSFNGVAGTALHLHLCLKPLTIHMHVL